MNAAARHQRSAGPLVTPRRGRLGMSPATLALLLAPAIVFAQKSAAPPETFIANAQVTRSGASASATVTIQIDHYTQPDDLTTMQDALKYGGYPRFLPALRQAPVAGSVEMAGRKVLARWARQVPTDKGRTISVVTESPIAFLGGSGITSKPRAGYELAILLFDVDTAGTGSGTMAAAARVKPGGASGVQVDDYADTPITLTGIHKASK